jgi:hypothetical protein
MSLMSKHCSVPSMSRPIGRSWSCFRRVARECHPAAPHPWPGQKPIKIKIDIISPDGIGTSSLTVFCWCGRMINQALKLAEVDLRESAGMVASSQCAKIPERSQCSESHPLIL